MDKCDPETVMVRREGGDWIPNMRQDGGIATFLRDLNTMDLEVVLNLPPESRVTFRLAKHLEP